MGLLDEAIREHLDLKRRRGADPTEVERLEREALGPVRRVGQEQPGAEMAGGEDLEAPGQTAPPGEFHDEDGFGPEDEFAHEDEVEHEPGYEYGPEDEDEYAAEEPPRAEESAPYPDPERPSANAPEPHAAVPPPEPAPAYADPSDAGRAEPPPHGDLGAETAEYDVEAAHAEEEDDEDVLEETPEFLQDTPDHDRLWFEQRPPKDFDFEG